VLRAATIISSGPRMRARLLGSIRLPFGVLPMPTLTREGRGVLSDPSRPAVYEAADDQAA
jgi:hypothetical protein